MVSSYGWGEVIRTPEWRSQSPLPYRLATPQYVELPFLLLALFYQTFFFLASVFIYFFQNSSKKVLSLVFPPIFLFYYGYVTENGWFTPKLFWWVNEENAKKTSALWGRIPSVVCNRTKRTVFRRIFPLKSTTWCDSAFIIKELGGFLYVT